ncbi:MAG: formyltransferase family protein [Brumimicrobium sp.]
MKTQRLAIFASGNGSNAVRLIEHFRNHPEIKVVTVLSNNKNAGVIEKVKNENIEKLVITNDEAANGKLLIDLMQKQGVDYIILAGYLRKIPAELINAFEEKIINVHPALLPKFGGKGMYGIHVHQAVKEAREKETGISIHLVNQNFDEGRVLARHKVIVDEFDEKEEIQRKVQALEHHFFAKEIEKYILKK